VKKYFPLAVLFLTLNFSVLAIGSWLMNGESQGDWYQNLTKASWTPPGWVFGFAWTFIMLCFSLYLVKLITVITAIRFWLLFGAQFVLNISWNYVFFNQHNISLGLVILILLTLLILFYTFSFIPKLKKTTLLVLPYTVWLCLATSLNLYIYLNN